MFNLDYQSRLSIYEQIVEQFERYIAYGVLKPKEQVPSIRELAAALGINPNTVKKAYEELEKRGVITTVSTKGTFVTDNIKEIVKGESYIELSEEEAESLERAIYQETLGLDIENMK
jgi:GntR family transcriptional regulator